MKGKERMYGMSKLTLDRNSDAEIYVFWLSSLYSTDLFIQMRKCEQSSDRRNTVKAAIEH